MTSSLQILKAFDVNASDATVWAFKKSGGLGTSPPAFSGRWIETTTDLDEALKGAVVAARDSITETKPYDLLAQNNEGSALAIGADETHAAVALAQIADPTSSRRVGSLKEINNTAFYIVKFVCGADVLYAVKKTDGSWRSMKSVTIKTAIFADSILGLDLRPRFTISSRFDFFVVGEEILVLDKARFESILDYKQGHVDDFALLQTEPAFTAAFTGLSELVDFVGTKQIQLRRASAIKTKGHYKDKNFMDRLRVEAENLGFKIAFDTLGRIAPTPESCPDIIQALLDHRLDSRLSKKLYDVDDVSDVVLGR
jgi:hypothetical protein